MFGKKIKNISLTVSEEKCTGCGRCTEKCRRGAILLKHKDDKSWAWLANPTQCTGCGKCARVCKTNAIEVTELSDLILQGLQ